MTMKTKARKPTPRAAVSKAMAVTSGNGDEAVSTLTIPPPNMQQVDLDIVGTAPLMVNKFSNKAGKKMRDAQEAGGTAKTKRTREPKNFEQLCKDAAYISEDGWHGVNASGFRNAAIAACRTVGYKMTHAKLAIFIEEDGFDKESGTPMVRITKGKPEMDVSPARNSSGVIDLRPRPKWRAGWTMTVRVRYDADMFTSADIINLMSRVGRQVGIGEGRPSSRNSAGLGYGLFRIDTARIMEKKGGE